MGFIGKVFYTTGKASATRPWTSIFIGLVICGIGGIGFVNWQSTVSNMGPYRLFKLNCALETRDLRNSLM